MVAFKRTFEDNISDITFLLWQTMKIKYYILSLMIMLSFGCGVIKQHDANTLCDGEIELIVMDPGHFHADLLLKKSFPVINDTVYVYAPEGVELDQYLKRVSSFNQRADNPTSWVENVYVGADYLEQMLNQQKGNVVILAGNNYEKTDYILQSVKAGINVLADKPMAINKKNFSLLVEAFEIASQKGVVLYDIMTERYDVLNEIERILLQNKALFGTLVKGTTDAPAVEVESVHHFYKTVAGKPLVVLHGIMMLSNKERV